MEIQEKYRINFQLNPEDLTASIVESPKATGIVIIPRYFRYQKKNYTVTTIKSNAFYQNTIESITFADNSEVTTFEEEAFENSTIKKLQIPPKLNEIENRTFFLLKGLIEFDVSPKNHLFSYYNNELLIGKSQEDQNTFDILYLGRSDLTKVTIPSSIRVIKRYAFGESPNLETIKFDSNSQIEYIEGWVLCENLKKFEIPKTLKSTERDAFQYAYSLVDIFVSIENEVFSWIDDMFLIRRDKEDGDKETIAFCRRNVTEVIIPKNIKEIDAYAFLKCENLNSISFEKNSKLEVINESAFEKVNGLKDVVIPSSVRVVKKYAFCSMESLRSIQFLSEKIEIQSYCFCSSYELHSISFPNAKKIIFNDSFEDGTKIFMRKDAEISGVYVDENRDHIEFIKEVPKTEKVADNERQPLNHANNEKDENLRAEMTQSDSNQETKNDSRCCLLI